MIRIKEILTESKYKAHTFADVVDDIVKDEKFKNIDRVSDTDSVSGNVSIHIKDRDKQSANKIIRTLKQKYGVTGKWNESESAVVVSGGALVEGRINENKRFESWVVKNLRHYIGSSFKDDRKHLMFVTLHVLKGALVDANFHTEAKKLNNIFLDAEYNKEIGKLKRSDYVKLLHNKGQEIAQRAKWDGKLIVKGISEYLKTVKLPKESKEVRNLVESINVTISERHDKPYPYFQSFTDAAQYARDYAENKGYDIDEDEWFSRVGTGGRYTRARPSVGKTHEFTVGLFKRGRPAKKALHFQVYGMPSGTYELNTYIS